MNQSKISVRYAKAFFSTAIEKNMLNDANNDMKTIYDVCFHAEELSDFFNNPVIKTSQKKKLVKEVFGGNIHQISLSFINLIIENKRENYIVDIARNFLEMYRKQMGIKEALFTSAYPIDSSINSQIIDTIKKLFKTEVELHNIVDEKIIGGYVLRVEDKQIDASVASKLSKIKRELKDTSFDNKLSN